MSLYKGWPRKAAIRCKSAGCYNVVNHLYDHVRLWRLLSVVGTVVNERRLRGKVAVSEYKGTLPNTHISNDIAGCYNAVQYLSDHILLGLLLSEVGG